jgi:hypothetical protein
MTEPGEWPDPLGLAGVASVAGGCASLLFPYFLGLCIAASGLLALAWLLELPTGRGRLGPRGAGPGAAVLLAGWGGYLTLGPFLGRFVALPLLLGAAALWALTRRPGATAGRSR